MLISFVFSESNHLVLCPLHSSSIVVQTLDKIVNLFLPIPRQGMRRCVPSSIKWGIDIMLLATNFPKFMISPNLLSNNKSTEPYFRDVSNLLR